MAERLIIVQGPPGSGKSTLASELAKELEISLISKDVIKEALYDAAPIKTLEDSVVLGRAAIAAMYGAAEVLISMGRSCIVESAFNIQYANSEIEQLVKGKNIDVIQLYCRVDDVNRERRFMNRQAHEGRHPVHFDSQRIVDLRADAINFAPLTIERTIIIDTSHPVDIQRLTKQLQ